MGDNQNLGKSLTLFDNCFVNMVSNMIITNNCNFSLILLFDRLEKIIDN